MQIQLILLIVSGFLIGCSGGYTFSGGDAFDAESSSDALLRADLASSSRDTVLLGDAESPLRDADVDAVASSSDSSAPSADLAFAPDLAGALPSRSCKELHDAQPGLPDGVYTIAPEGNNGLPQPFSAWCDMTTDGGGWTMLLNPSGRGLPPAVAELSIGLNELNGRTCGAYATSYSPFDANGWHGIRCYGCGTVSLALALRHSSIKMFRAKDIMFVATAQSWQTRVVTVNGQALAGPDAVAPQGGCAFWNGAGKAGVPASPNACWAFALPEPPHIYKSAIDGAATLALIITVGPAGMPDPSYGAGANIQRLGIR